MTDLFIWRAPGNSSIFDSQLNDWNTGKMSQRTVGVMQFLKENPNISIDAFKSKIPEYLNQKYGHEFNESTKSHFYRPLEFYGFVIVNDIEVNLSDNGKKFLNLIQEKNYDDAMELFILRLFQTSYPNHATNDVKLSLFPFRIMFKLLLETNLGIPSRMFLTEITHIKNMNDLNNVLLKISDENYLYELKNCTINQLKLYDDGYDKWNSWVISSLKKLNILEEQKYDKLNYIKLAKPINEFIENKLSGMEYKDMFF